MKNSSIVYVLIFILILLILFMNMSSSSYYASATETKLDQMNNPTQKAKLIQLSNTNQFYQMGFEKFVELAPVNELKNVDTLAKYDSVAITYIVPEMKTEMKKDPQKDRLVTKLIDMPDAKTYKFAKYLQSYLTKDDFMNNQFLMKQFFLENGKIGDFVDDMDKKPPRNASDVIQAIKLNTPGYPNTFLSYINTEYTALIAIPDKQSPVFLNRRQSLLENMRVYMKTVGIPEDMLIKQRNLESGSSSMSTGLNDQIKNGLKAVVNVITQPDVNTLKSLSNYDFTVFLYVIKLKNTTTEREGYIFIHNLIEAGKLQSFITDAKTQGTDIAIKNYSNISSSSFLLYSKPTMAPPPPAYPTMALPPKTGLPPYQAPPPPAPAPVAAVATSSFMTNVQGSTSLF